MALNSSKKAVMHARRAYVANLRLRGLTHREIVSTLEKKHNEDVETNNPNPIGCGINPRTKKAWSVGIINEDIANVEKEWKESALRDIIEHKARQLAEIAEVKKQGWSARKFDIVLKALDQEANIMGTKATIKHELDNKVETPPISALTCPIEASRVYQKLMKGD